MDIFNNLFSSSDMLNEQIARKVIDATPENGMAIAIADLYGNMWTNELNDFVDWQEYESMISLIFARLADGQEIVIANCRDYCFIACDMEIDSYSKGYVIMAFTSEFITEIESQIPIVEFSLKQVSVLASAIHKNNNVIHDTLRKKHTPARY